MERLAVVVALAVAARAALLPESVPPPVKRVSTSHMLDGGDQPRAESTPPRLAPRVTVAARRDQALVQASTGDVYAHGAKYYTDSDGDTQIVLPPPGSVNATVYGDAVGATDHFQDEQFYLNVAYDELEFNEEINVTWVRPGNLVTKLDYVGLYQRSDPDDAIPCNWEFAEGAGSTGSVGLQMTNYGDLEIRYFDVAMDRPRVKLPVTVFPPCPNNCTLHGNCVKGKCQCHSPYKGEECCSVSGSIKMVLNTSKVLVGGTIEVTLTPPVGDLDKRNWVGVFPAELVGKHAGLAIPSDSGEDAESSGQALLQTRLNTHTQVSEENFHGWWFVGNAGESCDTVCELENMTCSVSNLTAMTADVNGKRMRDLMGSMGVSCQSVEEESGYTGAPYVGKGGKCTPGLSTRTDADCSKGVSIDDQRLCVCDGVKDWVEFVDVSKNPPYGWRYANDQMAMPMPHRPGRYRLKVVQNIVTHPVLGTSDQILVVDKCPNNCSGHGVCVDGVCECDTNYTTFPDCRQANGLVKLTVSSTDVKQGDLITVTWERNSDGGFTDMDYIALYLLEDTNYDTPFTYQFAQAEVKKVGSVIQTKPAHFLEGPPVPRANDENAHVHPYLSLLELDGDDDTTSEVMLVDRGTVEFNAPMMNGTFVFRYFRRDHTEFANSEPFSVYPECIVPDCSTHGTCVRGDCECETQWSSFDCSVGVGEVKIQADKAVSLVSTNLPVTWSRPVKVGSIYDFIAIYAEGETNDKPLAYVYAHDESDTDATTGTVQVPVPHAPGMYDVRYVDAFSRDTVTALPPLEAHMPCPNECSGHGTCEKDTCKCTEDWTVKDDCSARVGVTEITATPLFLVTPSDEIITVNYKRPEGQGSPVDFIGLFRNGSSSNRRPIDFKPVVADGGTVTFPVPSIDGVYTAKYIAGAESAVRAKSLAIEVTKRCLNDCQGHGKCGFGVCECLAGWDGEDCSVGVGPTVVSVGPKLGNPGDTMIITYTRPVNTGSDQDFLATYKKGSTDMSSPYQFVMATAKDSDSVESTFPNLEAELEVHYVRGTDQLSRGVSSPFNVVFTCKDDCNSHGDCTGGVCHCHAGYDGMSCNRAIPKAFSLRLVSGSTVAPLGRVELMWDLVPALASSSDWVGIFSVSDAEGADPAGYEYTGGGAQPTGSASLMAPGRVGDYVGKYVCFKSGKAEVKATSSVFSVMEPPKECPDDCQSHGTCDSSTGLCSCGAGWAGDNCNTEVPTTWEVQADANQYLPGGFIEARWIRPPDSGNFQDRIMLTKVGMAEPLSFQYSGTGNMGTLYFAAPTPAGEAVQSYQLKFANGLKAGSDAIEASSTPFTVMKDGTAAHSRLAAHHRR